MDLEDQGPREAAGDETGASPGRRVWERPEVRELPRLTDLTLQTGSPIPGLGNLVTAARCSEWNA